MVWGGREPYRNTFNLPPISILQNIGCTLEMFITLHSKEVFNMVSVHLTPPPDYSHAHQLIHKAEYGQRCERSGTKQVQISH